MPPQPLDGTALPVTDPGDRREHLAAWLTGAENPYFARAAVNRIWKNFFGRGLVDPEDDLRKTNPASNRPLLDALATNFSDNGFDRKKFIKTIALSAAYQRSSRPHLGNDDDEVFYSHYIVRRLPAEVLLDAYSAVTERPTPFKGYPKGYRALQLRDSEVASYFLKTFGRPDRKITCACERTDDSSLTQVLHLSNGDTLDEKITAEGGVVSRLLRRDFSNSEFIDHFYLAALTRFPTPEERDLTLRVVTEAASAGDVSRREALEDVLWGILSSKEFLFNK